MVESVRIMNSLVIPADIVEMLAGGGWDAEKCCNPKLQREEKKLDTGLEVLKRSIEDGYMSSSQTKKQKTTAAVSQKEPSKVKNSLIGIPTPTDQDSRESSLLITDVVVKTEEEFPKPAIPCPAGSLHNWTFGEMNDGPSSHSCRGSIEADVGPHVVSNAAAIKNTRPVDIIGSPKVTKPSNPVNSSSRGAHEIDTSSSISPRRKKHTSRKGLKRTIDTVSSSLAVTSADHSVKLQDQAGRLRECSENLKDHSIQLQKHTKQLRKQDSALAQLRQDNQALRDSFQEVLLPLAQAVNALRKSSKDDKRALKSTKKRAERGLKELKFADKNTKVLKQSFENVRYILEAAEGRHGGKSDAQGQEN
ncbi:hypothetical protein LZ30DRAFT_588533 [Colletotrichum cereale]|nr:hypothetical protein LZ30DRAFT_588533 [Colletotrichum cereale]